MTNCNVTATTSSLFEQTQVEAEYANFTIDHNNIDALQATTRGYVDSTNALGLTVQYNGLEELKSTYDGPAAPFTGDDAGAPVGSHQDFNLLIYPQEPVPPNRVSDWLDYH